ncbi:MAG: diguanylate cyclase [Leptolinea sp.]
MTAEKVIHDPLTGLYNRRHLYDMFDREITHAERKNEPVSVIISDADRFKEINDTSELLKGVAAYPAHG